MGNWMTVNIVGTCDMRDTQKLRKFLTVEDGSWDWKPLSIGSGLCGLGDWVGTHIDAVGNLFERGYTVEDIAQCCREMLEVAPSLNIQIHCGGDYESIECVATILAGEGLAVILPPNVKTLKEISEDQITANLMKALYGR